MRFQRFYVEKPIDSGKENSLPDAALAHQLRRVFRLQRGDKAIFFDGSGVDHVSEIVSVTKDTVTFRVLESRSADTADGFARSLRRKVALAASLIKKDNFEWVVQKGTELGVSEFIPLVSERSEKKDINMERARKIMIEACEQSGRGDVPVIREPISLEDFLGHEKRETIAFHTEGAVFAPKDIPATDDIVACVGPEGGWTGGEVEAFKKKGATIVRLDAPILRAETAAVAIATLLLLL